MNAPDSDSHDLYRVTSLVLSTDSNAVDGDVRWDPCRSLRNGGMLLSAVVLEPMTSTWRALALLDAHHVRNSRQLVSPLHAVPHMAGGFV